MILLGAGYLVLGAMVLDLGREPSRGGDDRDRGSGLHVRGSDHWPPHDRDPQPTSAQLGDRIAAP
jgi:hypothetical protein